MTTLIQVKQLSKSFGEREVLKDCSFQIRNGEKIGLVGWNGTGKTTLIKLLSGLIHADTGSVTTFPSTLRIGYLPQSTEYEVHIENELYEHGEKLLHATSALGLDRNITTERTRYGTLSGGERLKLSLAKIWANQPQFLCLDEPTNHLDMRGVNWLVSEVANFDGAAIIISHDRYFLDQTVTKIFEIEDSLLTIYEGNYTDFRKEKQRRIDQQAWDYEKQQRKINMIEKQVSKLKQWSDKAHRDAGKRDNPGERKQMGLREHERVKAKKKDNQVKSKMKRLALELSKNKMEKPKEEQKVQFDFEYSGKRGKRILEAKGLTKSFTTHTLFEKSHFYVKHGEKIGLIGENGVGKSTFIKMLMEEEEITKGSLWKSESIKIAYLSQDVDDMNDNQTALEYLNLSGWENTSRARTIFANMGMKEEKLNKPLSVTSLGEKTRVKLVHMIMQEYDVLILDEPTNHLDLPSREQLENTLTSYMGTLIIISHDRYFIEKLCDKLLVIENKRIKRVETGLGDFRGQKDKQLEPSRKEHLEKLAILETKITELLGKICIVNKESEEYAVLDRELVSVMGMKKMLKENGCAKSNNRL
ncbi:ribosomal protection-like ABC-F family protein [Sutcliffiella rhizosphaerae]|uniref:Nucleotide-binding protein ExpZ n=1 Tax=Sutcliffiella rhizosphaerae TaxID=2880967 RepID=A0ABN8ABU4_9BACI|nr:ABC-F type ribosomal protection protein [Sutcliffiella rhizosphaerae]CAG9620643.1 Nucleotide-binding protein ExpZ [Sutcliffiella rhizosphaerae]